MSMIDDPLAEFGPTNDDSLPLILAIALRMTQLSFPDLIYTGKLVSDSEDIDDCELCLFARSSQGEPLPNKAINLEIMRVGEQRSITAEYPEQENLPILWYGQHAVWMDGETGKTVTAPIEGIGLERLARGILTRLSEIDAASESESTL